MRGLSWIAAESNQQIGTAPQHNASMNRPFRLGEFMGKGPG